ncbi:MAG: hypothetical protein IKT97_07835 [Spirochaetia bacterium]|nr:hypothetical protein [Spirochaetia bacterium]
MSRRSGATKREFIPDPRYNSTVVAKFITRMMFDGKKSISTKIMYDAMEFLSKKTDKEPIEALTGPRSSHPCCDSCLCLQ